VVPDAKETESVQLVRYVTPAGVGVGVRDDADGAPRALPVPSLAALWQLPVDQLRDLLGAEPEGDPVAGARLLPPIDELTEVWAAGVTYRRSSEARQEESEVADVYDRVYRASRPELFFKSPAWRVCGDGEPVGVRADSEVDVPEPELAVVCNAAGVIVGLTICDDVSSRSIEGENPLYLPQAKIYAGSCALGPGIVPVWEIGDVRALGVSVEVRRAGTPVWADETSTQLLHRSLDDLLEHLYRQARFPHGVVLSTGTGLVPELDFTLQAGDEVVIEIDRIGRLRNPVRAASDFGWLTPAPDRMPA
jgi:2-dehydro-3-deoxy-D-arabinonate dehydratase